MDARGKKQAKRDWEQRYELVREVINRYDPVRLIEIGAPEDEYSPEMNGILKAIDAAQTPADLAYKVEAVFNHYFGGPETVRFDRWREVADELWKAFRT